MPICYSVQKEAQTLVSYENLWFVYVSLRARVVPRLELYCWKRSHWARGSKYTKTINCGPFRSFYFFLIFVLSNVNKWSTSGHKHFVKLSRKLLPMETVIFNVRRKVKTKPYGYIFILDLKISYHLVRFIIINHLFFLCQLPRVNVLLRKVICLSTFVLAQNPTLRYIYPTLRLYIYIYII